MNSNHNPPAPPPAPAPAAAPPVAETSITPERYQLISRRLREATNQLVHVAGSLDDCLDPDVVELELAVDALITASLQVERMARDLGQERGYQPDHTLISEELVAMKQRMDSIETRLHAAHRTGRRLVGERAAARRAGR